MEKLIKIEELKEMGYKQVNSKTFEHKAKRNFRAYICGSCGCVNLTQNKPEGKKNLVLANCFWCSNQNGLGI